MGTFDAFFAAFERTAGPQASEPWDLDGIEVAGFREMMSLAAGATFNQGLLRIHSASSAAKADAVVLDAFPEMLSRRNVHCFAMDWLGCQYSINPQVVTESGAPSVFLYDVGDGGSFKAPASFGDLFAEELLQFPDDYLNINLFGDWRVANSESLPLGMNQCVGYAHPLVLGGDDGIENLEVTDWEVYWGFAGQFRLATSGLDEGTSVEGVHIAEG